MKNSIADNIVKKTIDDDIQETMTADQQQRRI